MDKFWRMLAVMLMSINHLIHLRNLQIFIFQQILFKIDDVSFWKDVLSKKLNKKNNYFN